MPARNVSGASIPGSGVFLGYDLQNAMTYMEAYRRIERLRPKLDATASEAKKTAGGS